MITPMVGAKFQYSMLKEETMNISRCDRQKFGQQSEESNMGMEHPVIIPLLHSYSGPS